jgi:cytochrome c
MRSLAVVLLALHVVSTTSEAADGNVARGETIYQRCLACHSLEHNRVGPRHCGLFGRQAGSLKDYQYSAAMKKHGVTWNEETLDRFIENPLKTVPGTKMGYAGVKDPEERADLIAYLKKATGPRACEIER